MYVFYVYKICITTHSRRGIWAVYFDYQQPHLRCQSGKAMQRAQFKNPARESIQGGLPNVMSWLRSAIQRASYIYQNLQLSSLLTHLANSGPHFVHISSQNCCFRKNEHSVTAIPGWPMTYLIVWVASQSHWARRTPTMVSLGL